MVTFHSVKFQHSILFSVLCVLIQPLKITGVKAYTEEVDKREVVLDLNLRYVSHLEHCILRGQE